MPDVATVTGICHRISVKELPACTPRDVVRVLEKDFALDRNKENKVSQEDIHFLNILDKTVCQSEDKHLEMPLPFKDRPQLQNNKPLAQLRLKHLKKKLVKDQTYYSHYKHFMNEMLQQGDAEVAESEAVDVEVWYIPHHGVYHLKKHDKLHVVFDCSARYGNDSLNQHLLTGPDLTNGLAGVLCRFRRHPVAIMCDVERMFHQFLVRESDRDFLRFLWWEDGNINTDKEPLEF